uniref:Nucleoside-diphosphate-sugar epimerase n=1 Tax=Candidatus Kentrum sp. UNK TaxID=2126344 RepID=A0A451ACI1_9GAMM|nr:MAG: Nucleoside-diphosphate-sugar epimerase [Candidatus Kentron sp. UNK]VFK70937.1 MAG: Nucleoside-diphosphate-sugar epimerase [Candidatus Kentron sp. UNK]
MSQFRILVTGASGFIGSHFISASRQRGHLVVALSRQGSDIAEASQSFRWSLGEKLPPDVCQPFDCTIHLAHDFDGVEGAQKTVEGTLAAMETLRMAGVRRQLFFSSLSSGSHATSLYGKTKLNIERHVVDKPDVMIIRPGLVLGEGGIYGRIRQWVYRLPIIPLPDGGHGKVPIIGIEHLIEQTLSILSMKMDIREFNLFEPELRTLRQLILDEAKKVRRKVLIIAVPSRFLLILLNCLEWLRIPLPIKADNLIGFVANQSVTYQPTIPG